MLNKLKEVEMRFNTLTEMLGDASVINDRERYREFSKEHSDLAPIIAAAQELEKIHADLVSSKELRDTTTDEEMRTMAQAELEELTQREEAVNRKLLTLLVPKDPNDDKNIILEMRAGAGGEEASLFVGELFDAYTRYAQGRSWKVEIMSLSHSSVGGLREVVAKIDGKGAFSAFKYERGVHRVQRVPKTETQGRVHTSTVTVAVLPEAEEVEVKIEDKDLRIDVFRSGGPGGQSVNTTDSAVRVTHIPSGLVVSCQDEKSQHKNKAKALTVLRARLYAQMQGELDAERSADRRSQVGTGERSERIRTYNFPQGRVTDHRIGLTIYQIESVMAGDLDPFIDQLMAYYSAEALKGS